jgi:peptidoglycan/LPS O-acetylase OafA/YrhL
MGVDLFFVLSGYLIGGQLLRASDGGRHVSFWEFYCPITSSPFTGP